MDLRQGIERKIESKRRELADLELKIREQAAYIRALEDTLKLVDGEDVAEVPLKGTRADSDVGKSQAALKKAGKPLHISDLLKAIGKVDDKRNRISLAGTLAGYARRDHIFNRPGPNIFGLIEFTPLFNRKGEGPVITAKTEAQEPPDDFGTDSTTDDDVPF